MGMGFLDSIPLQLNLKPVQKRKKKGLISDSGDKINQINQISYYIDCQIQQNVNAEEQINVHANHAGLR